MRPYVRAVRTSIFLNGSQAPVKEKLDQKIENLQQPQASNHTAASSSGATSAGASTPRRMQRTTTDLRKKKWISFMQNSTSAKLKQ